MDGVLATEELTKINIYRTRYPAVSGGRRGSQYLFLSVLIAFVQQSSMKKGFPGSILLVFKHYAAATGAVGSAGGPG